MNIKSDWMSKRFLWLVYYINYAGPLFRILGCNILNFLLKMLKLTHAKQGVFKIIKYVQLKVTLR